MPNVSDKVLTKFVSDNISSAIWMLPQDWKSEFRGIKRTFQFILLKVRLYSMFEPAEEGLGLAFSELMKFPQAY